jgi:hypothetical protein
MKIALRAEANGKWVCADDNFDGTQMESRPLQANRDGDVPPTGWETYDLAMKDASGAWVPFEFPAVPVTPPPIDPVPIPPATTGLPEINSQNFVVWGSDPACLNFPPTGRLTSWGLVPGTMTIATTNCDHWPAVAIDESGNPAQNATLWVLEQIGGVWYATGAERLRPEQLNGDKPSGQPPTVIGHDWLYDPARWGPMAYYNPAPGEIMGVLLVAGSTRSDNQTPLKARTNPLWIHWPNAQGANPAQVVTESESQALRQIGRDFEILAATSPTAVLGGLHWILSRYERLRGRCC